MPEHFEIGRLGSTFFAEVTGLDLGGPLDEPTFRRVHAAHLEHGVLVFRDQHLTPEQHVAFTRRFGACQIHPMSQFNLAGHPEILLVSSDRRADGTPAGIADAGRYWHTDMSYLPEPALGSLLYALAIPADGGDTLFADMQAAHDALPEDRRRQLEQLTAIHDFGARWEREARKGLRPPQTAEERARNPPTRHPLVRTHPETGAKCLYAGGFVAGIADLPEAEGAALVDWLERWCAQERFVHRHRWHLHDLVFWDNRRVMHHAQSYPVDQRRHMHRTTVAGDRPYLVRPST